MPPLRRFRPSLLQSLVAVVAVAAAGPGCSSEGSYQIRTVFDPCEPLVIEPAADSTADELAGVAAAIELWNAAAGTYLTLEDVPGAPRIPVRFETAASMFFGLYDDERAIIFVNRTLTEPTARTITIAHELGHAFGLLHIDPEQRASLMNNGNLQTPPLPEDVAALIALWGVCPVPSLTD